MSSVTIIAAMDKNRLIGNRNRLPWNIPEEMAFFREKTLGQTVIMGKNTFLSLGKPLEGRVNIVLTRDPGFAPPGVLVCNSIWAMSECVNTDEYYVIGGAQIFKLFLPLASVLLLTRIEAEFVGDTYFPRFREKEWETVSFESKTSQSGYVLNFYTMHRKPSQSKPKSPKPIPRKL